MLSECISWLRLLITSFTWTDTFGVETACGVGISIKFIKERIQILGNSRPLIFSN